jgi:hypothetical protein
MLNNQTTIKKKKSELNETSYILREYYKGFKIEGGDLIKLKDKINKIERSVILDCILKQDEEVYNIVSESYDASIDLVKY